MKVQLKLLIDGKEIEAVSCEKRHFIEGRHDKKNLVSCMVERITNVIDMEKFDAVI